MTSTAAVPAKKEALAPHVAEMRERNAMVTAIKGQMWSKDMNETQMRALAHYCNSNGLDASRHVEVLGGRIYLTADFYRERGAALVQRGIVRVGQTRYINADERLDKLAAAGDEWAKNEVAERQRERIRRNAPEKARAIAVVSITVAGSDEPIIGVNWCGGLEKKDPVGDSEPTKTAESRAERRAWKKLVEVVPEYGVQVRKVEATATVVTEEIAQAATPEPKLIGGTKSHPTPLASDGGYPESAPVAAEGEV